MPIESMSSEIWFDVHPSVIFQLGADLISDDIQALIELIKNSYDANATYAHVQVDTLDMPTSVFPKTLYPTAKGFIKITDDGEGMNLDSIKNGWFVVSNSAKRQMKQAGTKTDGKRTPLGDKGLGRLGSQRLAKNVELISVSAAEKTEQHVGFSWADFGNSTRRTDVPIKGPFPAKATRRSGTTLILSDLVDPERWRGPEAKKLLEEQFAELISPFEGISAFDLLITVDGVKLDLATVAKKLRQQADTTFSLVFDGSKMAMQGRVKLRQLEPSEKIRKALFEEQVTENSGSQLFLKLKSKSEDLPFSISAPTSAAWFAGFRQTVALDDLPKPSLDTDLTPINPGPFRGELDSFDLGRTPDVSAFSSIKEFRGLVKILAGVRVYRDGFGVRVDRDFLKLGKAWTGGSSWYGLKPANTIGYIAISARDNGALVETTDREGFKKTPHFFNFEGLLRAFVKFTHDTLEFARRETLAYCDQFVEEAANVSPSITTEELAEKVGKYFEATSVLEAKVTALRGSMAMVSRQVQEAARSAKRSSTLTKQQRDEAEAIMRSVGDALSSAEGALAELGGLLGQTPEIRSSYDVLSSQIRRFSQRMSEAYETMSLGLTAEALVHEISVIAEGLAERAGDLKKYIDNPARVEAKTKTFLRHVDTSVAALRKQLGHLDPSLKYARERRESIVLLEFVESLKNYHESRWREGDLVMEISSSPDDTFVVNVNRGKLTQIFDNLILDSQHWLRETIRRGKKPPGKITIELRAPLVLFSDNGRGIDSAVAGTLFEPFVTTREDGRGLGLFIVRELLDSEGSTIRLSRSRNSAGRPFEFELDLSGMIDAGKEN
jgi:signal transduction histidine kinase